MSLIEEKDVTGTTRHSTLVQTNITVEMVPDRQLRVIDRPRESVKPVHVRSVQQMSAFAQRVASQAGTTREFGLLADPGLGKSTVFPLMLAKKTGGLVLLIEFCGSLASQIRDGLADVRSRTPEFTAVGISWYRGHEEPIRFDELELPHVVTISARKLLGRTAVGLTLPDLIAVHDESHYSDYAAYTWRNVAAQYPWVKANVALSATLSPSVTSVGTAIDGVRHERREVVMVVPPVGSWLVRAAAADTAVPWAVDALCNKRTLVFSDDHVANVEYGRKLEQVKYTVFHLTPGRSAAAVEQARAATDRSGDTVVIFASAPYRNGFNFKLDVVIDCGLVREEFVAGGKVWERYRRANQTEVVQGAARVGRCQTGVVYRDRADYPTHIPILALGEVRHAAAMHILLGFTPPEVLVELVPETARWGKPEALLNIRRSLDEIAINKASVRFCTPAAAVGPAAVPAVNPVPRTAVPDVGRVGLDEILTKAQALSVVISPVDEVFPSGHPGVRYEVPTDFYAIPDPYWVKRADACKMMRLLLSGSGRYDADMLTVEEVHWFARTLVAAWNDLSHEVVNSSVMLAAVHDATESNQLYGHAVRSVQDMQSNTAMLVREMEAVLSLLRSFYTRRPFPVRCVDAAAEEDFRARCAIARTDADAVTVRRTLPGGSGYGSTKRLSDRVRHNLAPRPFAWQSGTPAYNAGVRYIGSGSGSESTMSGST